jgi:hypothetical protein
MKLRLVKVLPMKLSTIGFTYIKSVDDVSITSQGTA